MPHPLPPHSLPRCATPEELLAVLDGLGIRHTTTRHPPAFTVEEGNAVWGEIPGIHCKNLFLKDAKAQLWLVVAPADQRIDLKRLPERIGSARLSFGSAALLAEVLGVQPGSVTPFALVNDAAHRVTVVLDAGMMDQPLLNYHPLSNQATTTLSNDDFRVFLKACGHPQKVVALPG